MDTSPDFVIINRRHAGDRFFISGMDEGTPGDALIGLYAENNRAALQLSIEYQRPSKAKRRLIWIRQAKASSYLSQVAKEPAANDDGNDDKIACQATTGVLAGIEACF